MDRLIKTSGYRGPVVVTTIGIKPREMTKEEEEEHGPGGRHEHKIDPHAWQNLANGQIYVDNITKGLSAVDYDSNRWVTYTPIHGPREGDKGWEARLFQEGKLLEKRPLKAGLTNNFVWYCEFQGEDIWVATSRGLSHGIWKTAASTDTASAQEKKE